MKLKESDVKTIAEYCRLEESQVPGFKLLLDTLMNEARAEGSRPRGCQPGEVRVEIWGLAGSGKSTIAELVQLGIAQILGVEDLPVEIVDEPRSDVEATIKLWNLRSELKTIRISTHQAVRSSYEAAPDVTKPWAVLHAVARDGQEGETRMLYEPGNLEAEIDATFQRLEGSLLREEAWLLEIRDACWMRVTFDQDGRQTIRDAARDDVPEVSMRIVREFVEREAMQALMRATEPSRSAQAESTLELVSHLKTTPGAMTDLVKSLLAEPPAPRSKQALALDGESIASLIYERADGWAFTIRHTTQVAVMYSPTDTRKVGCWARSLLAPEAFLRGPELLPYWLRIEAAEGREGAFLIAQELVPETIRLRHEQLMREGIAVAELDEHRGPPGGVSREAFEETLKQAALPSSDPNKRDDGTC